MSPALGLNIAALLLAITICQALPDLHKQMSPQQLQSVFHVETHADVPAYEVVQLLHHSPHRIQRRSIVDREPLPASSHAVHHVKKDLSKNAYYSELKQRAATAASANHLDISEIKTHNVSFSAFGQQHNLTLQATKGLFKGSPHQLRMWTVGSEANATHGLDLQELDEQHNQHDIGEVYQDENNMAAILMRRHMETGDLIMEGSIGHDIVIKPLPHELSPSQEDAHHIVYKREAAATDEQLSDFAFMEPDDLLASEKLERLQRRQKRAAAEQSYHSSNSNSKDDLNDEDEGTPDSDVEPEAAESRRRPRPRRQAPYIIYPEVLVIVDYDGYRLHGGDNLQVKRYFISFWNGVDLRYRLLKGPRIRISIAGIIISRGRDATPYLERNRVGRDAIDSAAALTDMGKYLFRERRLPVYDIAVAITKYDMCRRRKGGRCTKGTAGFAYVGGACVVNKRLEKVNSVAIIEDTGGFSGIIVAAHEVGHLLGAVHDGSPPPSYLGGPGAQRCRWEDGYIMSDLRHTERGFRWSACTVQSFHHFLNGDTATCLHNAPHEDSALGRSLPGSLLSLDAQCRRDRGTYACFKDERVCAQLFCFDAQTGYCVAYRPAAEGSACGNGFQCLDGRCTPVQSNVIPDYGHNYRLVYNKTKNSNKDAASESTEDSENSSEETESNEDGIDNEEQEQEDEDEGLNSSSERQDAIQQDNKIESSSAAVSVSTTTTSRTAKKLTKTTEPQTTQSYKKSFGYLRGLLPQEQLPISTDEGNDDNLALHNTETQWLQNGGVVVKTRTSTSVSSSSRSGAGNQYTSTTTATTPKTTSTQPPNLFQMYTHELRKQIEYYLHLLQQQPQQKEQSPVTPTEYLDIPLVQKQAHTTTFNKNYSASSNSNINNNNNNQQQQPQNNNIKEDSKRQQLQQQQQQQQQHDEIDEENEANAGIESNEAIERQKRKFLIQQQPPQHLKTLQEQQPHQLATPTIAAKATTSKIPTTATTTISFLDAYFKKLQALHSPTNDGAVTATTTSTSVSSSVSSSRSTTTSTSAGKQQLQRQPQQQQNYDGSPFLKRTQNHNSKLYRNSNKNSSNSHTNSQQDPQQQQLENEQEQQPQQRKQSSPAYVTNYIGDNTNNLPSVLAHEQSTAATTTIQQEQHTENLNATTAPKKQKIKTQKLIRRTRVL